MSDSRVDMLKHCWKDSANIKVIFTLKYSSGCDRKSGMPQYLVYVLNTEDKTNCGGHIVCFHCVNHRSLFECFIFFQESLLFPPVWYRLSFVETPMQWRTLGVMMIPSRWIPISRIPIPNQYPNPIPFRFFDFFKNRKWPPCPVSRISSAGRKFPLGENIR